MSHPDFRLSSALVPLALASLASGVPTAAHAQTAGGGAQPTARLAVPGAEERRDLTISVTARYDSNVARVSDAALPATNLEREDIRIGPVANLFVTKNLAQHQVGLRSTLGYDFYTRNERLNRERLSVEPFAYLNLPVCDLALEGQAARQQSELGDLVFIGLNPGLAVANTETRKRINGRLICGDQFGLRPGFEAEYATGSNSNPLRRLANYEITRIQPSVGYSSPGLGEISVYAVRQETELPNQLLPNGQTGGFTLIGYGLSYSRAIGSWLNFSGSVAQTELTPKGGFAPPRSGINANVALTVVPTPRLQLTGFAARQFSSSLTSNSTYEVGEDYGLTATYAANDRVRLRAGGRYSPREFVYAVTPTGPFITDQKQYDIFGGATYSMNRRLRFTLDGGYQKRTADLALFDYDSVFVALGASFSF